LKILLTQLVLILSLIVGCSGSNSNNQDLASDLDRTFLYLLSDSDTAGGDQILGYEIASTGGLTALNSSLSIGSTESPSNIAVDPTGKYLAFGYITSPNRFVRLFSIDQTTGALTQVGSDVQLTLETSTIRWIHDMVFHPSGRYLYVRSDKIHTFSISESGDMSLVGSPLSVVDTILNSYGSRMLMNSTGSLLYVSSRGNFIPGEVFAYSVDSLTGQLTIVPGGDGTTGGFLTGQIDTLAITLSPDESKLYIGELGGNKGIKVMPVQTDGALGANLGVAPTSGFDFLNFANFVNDGKHFVAPSNGLTGDLKAYSFNSSTGALEVTAQGSLSVGNYLYASLFHSDAGSLYVIDHDEDINENSVSNIHVIEFNSTSGEMSKRDDLKMTLPGILIQMKKVKILN
jgi:6-phosphogluconolactonase (cycloisomerase 2 family)